MKSIVRTIVVLTALNLVMASFGLAMEATPEEPRETVVETSPPAISEPPILVEPPTLPAPRTASVSSVGVVRPWPIVGQTGKRRVLVIPTTDMKEQELLAIWEDMNVMAHIFDKKAKEPRLIRGVFVEFGEFLGRNSRDTEAIYLQGYGALFLMEVDRPFSPGPKPKQEEAEKTEEDVDPIWRQARDEVFLSKPANVGAEPGSDAEYGPEKVEELKMELIKALKHAGNIRNLKPDEWIILTVIGGAQQSSRAVSHRFYEVLDRQSPQGNPEGAAAGGSYGGTGGYGGGGAIIGHDGSYGMAGYGMAGFGAMGLPSATVLTIRAKKADVNAFAKAEIDFDEFQQHVVVLTYPHLSGKAAGEQRPDAAASRRPAPASRR